MHPLRTQIFISAVPMIAADMLFYVKSDLQVFGAIVLVLIVTFLFVFFRKPRWVALPLLICLSCVVITIGLLGLLGTPVTVVSSNSISLLSIISISFLIHLVVRYCELRFYTALTTLLAFGSMLANEIVPGVDFGWMMCLGIVIALVVTSVLFPALLLLLHQAIGRAMYFTPMTVMGDFSILAFSNFVPTVYFGLPLLLLYGLGTILGAGIYVLTGVGHTFLG